MFNHCLKNSAFLLSAVVLGLTVNQPVFAASVGYHVVGTQHIPGDVKWDYLVYEADTHRLFITHSDHVEVFDTTQKKIVGTVANTDGVHGVALAPDINRGFTSNGKANTISMFDLTTLKSLGTVPTEMKPDAIVYDAGTKHVFAANGVSGSLSVIDAVKGKNVGTIVLEGKPEFAVVDGKGRLFINIEDRSQMVVIDTKKLQVVARYDLSPSCEEPSGLAIDKESEHLFVGCHNEKMVVVDGNNGKVIASLPIGKGSDATVFDGGEHLAFSSNGDGTLTVVGMDGAGTYKVKQVVKTMPSARTMALDPVSHGIYLVGAEIDHTNKPSDQQPHVRPSLKDNSFTLISVMP